MNLNPFAARRKRNKAQQATIEIHNPPPTLPYNSPSSMGAQRKHKASVVGMFAEQAVLINAGHGPGDCVPNSDHIEAKAELLAELVLAQETVITLGERALAAVAEGRKAVDIAIEAIADREEAIRLLRENHTPANDCDEIGCDVCDFLAEHPEQS